MRHVSEKTLALFRGAGKCQLCSYWCIRREAAHVLARGVGAGRRLDISLNLLALGPAWSCQCHVRAHAGQIDPQRLFEAVAYREALDWRFVERQLWALVRAPKECKVCPWCDGHGSVKVEHRWGLRRHTCVCQGVGIVGPDGSPWVEQPRRLAGT